MRSEMGKSSAEKTSDRPVCFIECGGPVMDFRQARNGMLGRLEIDCTNGNEEEVHRLEEEAEVLLWKQRKAMMPDREVPVAILERFDSYPDHPRLPAAL